MPRIRTIKPDAFLSESLSSVPRGTRWTFAGLWTYADDKGRARDDARLIKAALYPLDDDVSLDDVIRDLALLAKIGGICRYVVEGRSYLHMPKWHHQKINRPTPAKSPPCPLHEDGGSGHVLDPEDSLSPHGVGEGLDEAPEGQTCRSDRVSPNSLSPHGALTEPSTWEREGKGNGREGEGSVPDRSATDAPPSTTLAIVERDDVERICEHLADRIEDNGSKRPEIGKGWRDAARLMLDKDGRAEAEVHAAIDWCQSHHFWRANVLSLPKLREKYDQLRLQAQRSNGGGSSRQQQTDDMFDRAMQRAIAKEQQMGIRP